VVFVNGWEYSNGCATEFATAVEADLPLYVEDLTPLDPRIGIGKLAAAVAELERLGEDTALLRRSWQAAERALALRNGER
jgi:hypothetical protein